MAGTVTVDTIKSSVSTPTVFQNTSGTEIGQLCKCWINFNGNGSGTIRGSFNVSSLSRVSTGVYNINFSNAVTDANFAATGSAQEAAAYGGASGTIGDRQVSCTAVTTTQGHMVTGQTGTASAYDVTYISGSFFR